MQEFPPVWIGGAVDEKIREMAAQRGGNEFRGAVGRFSGAQPRGKLPPDQRGLGGGEALERALSDQAELDVAMIGGEFAAMVVREDYATSSNDAYWCAQKQFGDFGAQLSSSRKSGKKVARNGSLFSNSPLRESPLPAAYESSALTVKLPAQTKIVARRPRCDGGRWRTRTADPLRVKQVL